MRHQTGFIQLPLAAWGAIAAGVLILGMGVALTVQNARLASCKQSFEAFKVQVRVLGEAAKAKAEAENKRLADLVKQLEGEYAKSELDLGSANAANLKLRHDNARSRRVSRPTETTVLPGHACYDGTKLQQAVRDFDRGVSDEIRRLDKDISELLNQSDKDTLRLKMSQDWAKKLNP